MRVARKQHILSTTLRRSVPKITPSKILSSSDISVKSQGR